MCWGVRLSKTVGPQMAWTTTSHHKGAVVSTHFLRQEQATHRHPHLSSSESAALVLLKLICLLALKNTSLDHPGERGEEEVARKMPGGGGK